MPPSWQTIRELERQIILEREAHKANLEHMQSEAEKVWASGSWEGSGRQGAGCRPALTHASVHRARTSAPGTS